MDIKALRGLSGTYNVRANERDRAAPHDIECLVLFLNNTQHKFVIDRRSKGQALLDCVFKHLNLIETDFFGLKYLPQDSYHNHHDITAAGNKSDSLSPQERLQSNSSLHLNSSSSSSSSNKANKSIVHNNNNYHDPHYQNNNNNSNTIREQHSPISKSSCLPTPSPPIVNHDPSHFMHTTNHRHEPCSSASPTAIATATATTATTTTIATTNTNTTNVINLTAKTYTNCSLPPVPAIKSASSSSSSPVLLQTSSLVPSGNCIENNSKQHDNISYINNFIGNSIDDNSEFIEERWLDPAKSIRKQYKACSPPYKFYFRVRFYVSDPSKLADDTTRNHLYLQLRQDILNNRLILPIDSAILLASYILQSEFGNYRDELLDANYAAKIKLLPEESDDFRRKVIKLHKEHEGLSSADAEHQFLEHAAKYLDCYGVEFYDAKDQFKTSVLIGVSSSSIVVFKDRKKMSQFSWAKIIKIMFKKKMFSIQLRREEKGSGNCDNFIEFNLISNQACKSFWEECVAQHSFFRLHQPKSPPKKFFSFLNFGSKFQYNGKTEYQTMEESRKRSFSHFSRTLSKRYARRTLPIGRPLWSEQTSESNQAAAATTTAGAPTTILTCINSQRHQNCQQHDNNSDNSHSRISTTSSSRSRSASNINDNINISQQNQQELSATLAESIKMIKKGLDKGDLITQFEKLSRKNEDESHDESRLMENIDKNRYQDILPYDSTRVQLMDSMTGDYINASFVNMVVPPGMVNRYIATQGPLASTCEDFWQMIWEQNCSLIIMVTPLIEAGRVKCHKYWPDEKEEVRYGQLLVKNINEKSKSAIIDRTMKLMDVKGDEKRTCIQIQYKAWPDHEVPEDCSDFLKLVNRVKKHRATQPNYPIVVHCSAGIGRTGVLILMETAICTMEACEPIYPINVLQEMRRQRAMLIQTSSQFKFVAEAICKVYDQKLYKKRSKKSRKKE